MEWAPELPSEPATLPAVFHPPCRYSQSGHEFLPQWTPDATFPSELH
jgi:hypothetical protein